MIDGRKPDTTLIEIFAKADMDHVSNFDELMEVARPKLNTPLNGTIICFGTAGEIDSDTMNTYKDLFCNIK